jgi:hypothetical protein
MCPIDDEKCREGDVIEKKMAAALVEAKSLLTTNNIIRRIRTQTCAGCHHYSNGDRELGVECPEGWPSRLCFVDGDVSRGIWPSTLGGINKGFTHVAENEPGESDTAKEVFDLSRLEKIDPDELRKIRPDRISHLSYMGPDGMCADRQGSRYKISDTLKYVLMPPRFENMVLYLNGHAN